MADNLKEIFEEAGEFAEANNNKLTLADAVVLIAEACKGVYQMRFERSQRFC